MLQQNQSAKGKQGTNGRATKYKKIAADRFDRGGKDRPEIEFTPKPTPLPPHQPIVYPSCRGSRRRRHVQIPMHFVQAIKGVGNLFLA